MNCRLHWFVPWVLAVILAAPMNGLGLEKTAAVVRGVEPGGQWRASTSCSVAYYNICTGWIWSWTGWSPEDRIGVTFESCCGATDSSTLNAVSIYVWTGTPSGYGFTGTLEVYDVDGDLCPTGAARYSQSWLPPTGYIDIPIDPGVTLNGTMGAVVFTNGSTAGTQLAVTTDHPAAGPTGPQALGFCYPTTRTSHSFYWGTLSTPVCPGSPFYDGIGNAELWWDAKFTCNTVAVEPTTWGSLKALYR